MPDSAWVAGNVAKLAWHVGNMAEFPKHSQPNVVPDLMGHPVVTCNLGCSFQI